jgi:hypothetical protein
LPRVAARKRLHVIEQRRRHVDSGGFLLPFEQSRRIGDGLERSHLGAPVAADQELALGRRIGIADLDRHQEAVELGFGQRIGADLLDRVLRRDDEERIGQLSRLSVLRNLALFHRFHQRALRLRRRAVDLVGQDDGVEDRAGVKAEGAGLGVEDRHAENIRREEGRS